MARAISGKSRKGEKGGKALSGFFLRKSLLGPGVSRLMFKNDARGGSDPAVLVIEVRPRVSNRSRVLFAVKALQLVA